MKPQRDGQKNENVMKIPVVAVNREEITKSPVSADSPRVTCHVNRPHRYVEDRGWKTLHCIFKRNGRKKKCDRDMQKQRRNNTLRNRESATLAVMTSLTVDRQNVRERERRETLREDLLLITSLFAWPAGLSTWLKNSGSAVGFWDQTREPKDRDRQLKTRLETNPRGIWRLEDSDTSPIF